MLLHNGNYCITKDLNSVVLSINCFIDVYGLVFTVVVHSFKVIIMFETLFVGTANFIFEIKIGKVQEYDEELHACDQMLYKTITLLMYCKYWIIS